MPQFQVSRSIHINAPIDTVYEVVSDFNQWRVWSPWLVMEPEATVNVAPDAQYYDWDGKRVGSGNMRITSKNPSESVDYDLTFLTPWKSQAKVRFELSRKGDGTDATWLLDSSLPFFMFWMKKSMTTFIGMDYERGLAMLKDYIETGKVHSSLEVQKDTAYPGCDYVGIKTSCATADIGPKMGADKEKLMAYFADKQDLVSCVPLSIYHKWDPVRGQVSYTYAMPVSAIPDGLSEDFVTGSVPATKLCTVRHTGPYTHIANAWATMNNLQQNKAFKINKRIHPFERYINSPEQVPAEELVTEINFAVQ